VYSWASPQQNCQEWRGKHKGKLAKLIELYNFWKQSQAMEYHQKKGASLFPILDEIQKVD
jgi:hypothetical protein